MSTLAATVLTAALSACAVGPDYERPPVQLPEQWSAVVNGDMTSTSRLARWWDDFNDPLLTELIEEVASQNLSLQAIGLRIIASRATLRISAGNRFPQLRQLEGEALRTGISDNSANVLPGIDDAYWEAALGAELSWEFDFWGKFRRNIEASQASLYEVIASYDAALVELVAETARTYLLVRTLQELLLVTQANVALQQRSLEISQVLARNERTTDLDVEQARTLLESTRSDIPQLEASLI
ncbi:MAG: TolC family protein, partial [Pseudomonadota bacterium]